MGVRANIYLISPTAYAAAVSKDFDAFKIEGSGIDLDKAWHAIHYLITGNPELRFLFDGFQISPGSETVEVHSPASLAALSAQLSETSTLELMSRFHPADFNARKIYPWDWEGGAVECDYIEENLNRFVALVHEAARTGKGIYVSLL